MGNDRFEVKNLIDEDVAGCIAGRSSLLDHSGRSSSSARGSITAPDRMCDPAGDHHEPNS